jgi:hypothetical protein
MRVCFIRLFGVAALAAITSLHTVAQEYSNGGKDARGRKAATLTPVEAFGVHPPGIDPADARRWRPRLRRIDYPYYAPLSPVASTARWKPWAYKPLLPYYTPYYIGYSPHRHFNPPPLPYGFNGWGPGPGPELPLPEDPETTPLTFGPYTSVVQDETAYWNMGGNGLVPYGAAAPPALRPPDLIDEIQASRPRRRIKANFRRAAHQRHCAPGPYVDTSGEQEQGDDRGSEGSGHRRTLPAEPIPLGERAQEQEQDQELKQGREQDDDSAPDRSSQQTKPAELYAVRVAHRRRLARASGQLPQVRAVSR